LFDSCFSGSIFALGRAIPENISYKTSKPVRQFITAGSADEQVPDESVFRSQFVAALQGEGDADQDGYLTGVELGEFLQSKVVNYSNGTQHPQYGKIRNPHLDKGDFVFLLPKHRMEEAKKSSLQDELTRLEGERKKYQDELKTMEAERKVAEEKLKLDQERIEQERLKVKQQREKLEAEKRLAEDQSRLERERVEHEKLALLERQEALEKQTREAQEARRREEELGQLKEFQRKLEEKRKKLETMNAVPPSPGRATPPENKADEGKGTPAPGVKKAEVDKMPEPVDLARLEPQDSSKGSGIFVPGGEGEVLQKLYRMLKAVEGKGNSACEADPKTRQCTEEGFGIGLVAPIPGLATHHEIVIKNVQLDEANRQIKFVSVNRGTYIGTPVLCSDSDVVLKVHSSTDIRVDKWEYFCNWMLIGNVSFERTHSFDYVNFGKGVIGGAYTMSGAGFPAAGSGKGYSLIDFSGRDSGKAKAGSKKMCYDDSLGMQVPCPQ